MRYFGAILYTLGLLFLDTVDSAVVDVCTGYKFTAACGLDELIVMETAELGRMEPGKCIPAESGNFGCRNDVLFLVDRWCSGRKQCEFTSPNSDIMDANTDCRRDLAVYLRAKYSCVKVLASQYCSTASTNKLPPDHGVISNHVTDELGCGSSNSPWQIEAEAGRTVEISLLDFKALDRARSHSLVTCSDVYGFILEKTLNINQTICGQNVRESVIYRSKTNTIEIHIKPKSGSMFTLTYTAAGCSDPKPPPNAWYKRNGNEAVIGCEKGDREWRLTCIGNVWTGKTGNCTSTLATVSKYDHPEDSSGFELSTIVIVAGIIGGTIVLAVAVIVCGVVYIQKYKSRQEKKYNGGLQQPQSNCSHDAAQSQYHPVSSNALENQDEYLQPNSMTTLQRNASQKQGEPLIHIWETPLPDPKSTQTRHTDPECTIHRQPAGQNPTAATKQKGQTGTSYYSPQTGHKYYFLDRQT